MKVLNFLRILAVCIVTGAASNMISACSKSDHNSDQTSIEEVNVETKTAAAEAEAAEAEFTKNKQRKPSSKESIYVVQVGTFKIEENAKKITEKLKAAGLPVVMKKIERENAAVLYAVRFEPTPSHSEAEKFVSTVKASTGESSLIMSVGN